MTTIQPEAVTRFTSDLSVDELILLTDAGWEPTAFVSGDCTSDPGDGYWSLSGNQGDALTGGLKTAMERLRKQAAEAGATGVVGVRLNTTEVEFDKEMPRLFHFSAFGTGIRPVGQKPGKSAIPFTSHLSGQETWALLTAGCKPLGMVFGVGFYRPKHRYAHQTGFHEMSELTNAVYGARERAMQHMQSQASGLHASGVVGVSIEMSVAHKRNITFTAIGTAIASPPDPSGYPAPRLAVGLGDHPQGATQGQLPLHGDVS
jgi:uncharacterized protein YbjQ (UPF0145 family)